MTMRTAPVVVLLATCFASACNTAAPPAGQAAAETSEDSARDEPAGFRQWLTEQCPDGRIIGAIRAETGELAGTAACEEARETALADRSTHEQLVRAYMAQTDEPAAPPGDERVGEARQPFSVWGFLCGVVVNAVIGYQCERVGYDWNQCAAATVVPDLICAFL